MICNIRKFFLGCFYIYRIFLSQTEQNKPITFLLNSERSEQLLVINLVNDLACGNGTGFNHYKGETTMNITDIKIRKIIPEGRLRAIISITIDDMLAIHDIKVVQGDERLFVAMPSRRDENGMFRDIVHPISPEARGTIEGQILDAYTRHIELMQAELEAEQSGTIL